MDFVTQKEEAVLKAIKVFFTNKGKMPTVREIREEANKMGVKIKSIGSIFLYLKSLEEKGVIERSKKGRGIKIIGEGSSSFASIPIMGTANAGTPTFFAQENIEGFLKVSKKLIKKDPSYGDIVCRCEMVSAKEVRDAIGRGATTLDGVKFRTRAQAGRCHGGFCTTRVLKILAEEKNKPVTKVTKRGKGSEIVKEERPDG